MNGGSEFPKKFPRKIDQNVPELITCIIDQVLGVNFYPFLLNRSPG